MKSKHIIFSLLCIFPFTTLAQTKISVGSKIFTESYLLAEYISQTLEQVKGVKVTRRFGMGGTGIVFEALTNNEIQLYPEYTGTIAEAILKNPKLKTHEEISKELEKLGLVITKSLGFNNTYALAVTKEVAEKYNLEKISDLRNISSSLRIAFSHEFITRKDGYKGLWSHYNLPRQKKIRSLEHTLAIEAIANGKADLIDIYSTDAKIKKLNLVILKDDLNFFPLYNAVILARKDFVEKNKLMWERLRDLESSIDAETMINLNSNVDLEKKSFTNVISNYLGKNKKRTKTQEITSQIIRRTKEHLVLVSLSLAFSILIGVPLGILATKNTRTGHGILLISGIVQTIPSLALLCFLIPLFGIGMKPALVALCMYSLLPVIMSTFVGLKSIDPILLETSRALGLNFFNRLFLIELPLASRSILSGIKTSTIIGIGTATLAALIGAGGYGVPIVTGLAINDINTILIGAVPAAVMALGAHFLFEALSILITPKGLRL